MISNLITTHYRKLILFLAIIIYVITAYNSHGYYHADEHYQIIEFAGIKLDTHTPNELAWEFKEQIRPTIQPTITYLILKQLNNLNICDQYTQMFILRLLTCILALFSINYFIKQTEDQFKNQKIKITYHLLSYLLWFIPFISVRYSSETLSGLLFLLSIAIYLNPKKHIYKALLIGLLLGFSYLFRFQTAFLIMGFFLWLFLIKKEYKTLIHISFSLVFVFILGVLIDTWFYNKFVISSYNYFYANIINDVASSFGTSPWHYYLKKFLYYPSLFIGIPLLASFIIVFIKHPKNIFVWCLIPFIFVHSIIPHKEERFLFPIVYFLPIILIIGYDTLFDFIKSRKAKHITTITLITCFAIINAIGLLAMSQKSAGFGRMEITKYIHNNFQNKNINLIYCSWSNPYDPWHGLNAKYYKEKHITEKRIDNLNELNDSLIVNGSENLLIIRKVNLEDSTSDFQIKKHNFKLKKESLPKWIQNLNRIYKGFDNNEIIMLYRKEL